MHFNSFYNPGQQLRRLMFLKKEKKKSKFNQELRKLRNQLVEISEERLGKPFLLLTCLRSREVIPLHS
jgi:hypothetical protein